MKKGKIYILYFFVFSIAILMTSASVRAQEIYKLTFNDIQKAKAFYDDPRPIYQELNYKKVLPPEVYNKLVFDQEKMKEAWAEVVGFKAPDVVGKVAPEIKPGTYTHADKEKYPFKELMFPALYKRFAPGAPPHIGNFSEIKVVPTRQYYWALPIAEATKKNMGQTKLNDQGYLIYDSYVAGIPFPKPEGNFKPQQIMYNWEKRYLNGENYYYFIEDRGFTKDFREDFESLMEMKSLKFEGRVLMEPKGWFDERAKKSKEGRANINVAYSPRDLFGNAVFSLTYLDPNKSDLFMIYLNAMRRVRKLSATDTQDPMGGQDLIYEDGDGFFQKLSATRYPYKYELIAEEEYLVPSYTLDGSGYLSSKGKELKNFEFERRPVYVVKLTQLDRNFVYGYRVLYFDKETFILLFTENYDQKGRLYRTTDLHYLFTPEMGMFTLANMLCKDHIDLHSMYWKGFNVPAPMIGRDDLNIGSMVKGK